MKQPARGSLVSNALALGLSRASVMVMNLATTSQLAKALGPANFGLNSFSISFVSYFLIVVNLGYETYLIREVAQRPNRTRALIGSAIAVRFLLAMTMALLLVLSLFVVDLSETGKVVVLIQGTMLFSSAISVTSVYQGLQRMHVAAAREILGGFFNLAGTILFVHRPADLPLAAAINAGTLILTNILILAQYCREFGRPPLHWLRRFDLIQARRSMVFFWATLMVSINFNTPVVLLGLMRSDHDVGLFAAGWRIFQVAITIPTLIAAVFLPRLATLNDQRKERMRIAGIFLDVLVFCSVAVSILGIGVIPQLILALFGASFLDGEKALVLILLNALVASVNGALTTPLMAGRRQNDVFRIAAIGTVIGIVLQFVMIPRWGIEGAALAVLIDQIVIMALLGLDRPEVPIGHVTGFGIRCLLASLPAAFVSKVTASVLVAHVPAIASVAVGGATGALVYVAGASLLRINIIHNIAELWRLR